MNQSENHLVCFLKTVAFVIFCLVTFSVIANRDSDYDSSRSHILSADAKPIHANAILNPAIDGVIALQPVITYDNKSQFRNFKLAFDSHLFNQRLITLRKGRESIISLHRFRYYLSVILSNHDDLPDLS